jgi:hypothetical protein
MLTGFRQVQTAVYPPLPVDIHSKIIISGDAFVLTSPKVVFMNYLNHEDNSLYQIQLFIGYIILEPTFLQIEFLDCLYLCSEELLLGQGYGKYCTVLKLLVLALA